MVITDKGIKLFRKFTRPGTVWYSLLILSALSLMSPFVHVEKYVIEVWQMVVLSLGLGYTASRGFEKKVAMETGKEPDV